MFTVWNFIFAASDFAIFVGLFYDPRKQIPAKIFLAKIYSTKETIHTNITSRIVLLP